MKRILFSCGDLEIRHLFDPKFPTRVTSDYNQMSP